MNRYKLLCTRRSARFCGDCKKCSRFLALKELKAKKESTGVHTNHRVERAIAEFHGNEFIK